MEYFLPQGEQALHVYLLLKGLVKVGGTTHARKEVLLDWMQPGESFGLGAVLSPPAENPWTVSSVANTKAFEWETAEVRLSDEEELAQMTGANLFTVNKIVRNWQRLGYVTKSRQRLVILDSVSLRRVSHSSAPSTSCKK